MGFERVRAVVRLEFFLESSVNVALLGSHARIHKYRAMYHIQVHVCHGIHNEVHALDSGRPIGSANFSGCYIYDLGVNSVYQVLRKYRARYCECIAEQAVYDSIMCNVQSAKLQSPVTVGYF